MVIFTIDQLKEQFEVILELAQSGETVFIRHKNKNMALIPYHIPEEDEDDLVRIHRDHEEGS